MKYGISWRSFVFPVERFLGAFFCFLWNEMLRTLPTSLKKENNKQKTLPTSPKNENKQKRDSPCRKQIADSLTKY